jgi:hypothetical protein
VYDFPKDQGGQTIYCNIEGVNWLGNDMFIAVSDQMNGGQGAQCSQHDESVHIFKLPATNPTANPTKSPVAPSPVMAPMRMRVKAPAMAP